MTEQEDVPSSDPADEPAEDPADEPTEATTEGVASQFEELFTGTQVLPDSKSMAHRMFFKRGEKYVAVKGECVPFFRRGDDYVQVTDEVLQDLVVTPEDSPRQVYARLFKYVVKGPPYIPHSSDVKAVRGVLGCPPEAFALTHFKVMAINAIHAREGVISTASAWTPGGYGPGFSVLWDLIEDGAPEQAFGKTLTAAYTAYDELVEKAVDYLDWEAKHGLFMGTIPGDQRQALAKVHASSNVEMELRFRAMRSDHWDRLSPSEEEEASADARRTEAAEEAARSIAEQLGVEAPPASQAKSPADKIKEIFGTLLAGTTDEVRSAAQSVADKFVDLFEGLSDEEKAAMDEVAPSLISVGIAAMNHPGFPGFPGQGLPGVQYGSVQQRTMTPEEIKQHFPDGLPGVGTPVIAGYAMPGTGALGGVVTPEQLVAAESAARSPFPGPDWVELTSGAPGTVGLGGDWVGLNPGMPPGVPPFAGMPHLQAAFGSLGAPPGLSPFQPGAEENFTLGDSEERDGRQLESAVGEADDLRARLHSDANERKRKLGLFRDVVSGAMHWAIEKVEGPPPPLPAEPVGPVEQILGRAGVNGSHAGVLQVLAGQRFGAPGLGGADLGLGGVDLGLGGADLGSGPGWVEFPGRAESAIGAPTVGGPVEGF